MRRQTAKATITGAAVLAVATLVLAGCGQPAAEPTVTPTQDARVGAIAPAKDCKDGQSPVASLAPGGIGLAPGSWPSGSTMAKIRSAGQLTVGTSGDVLLWGSRNPKTGNLEGYDIDLLAEVAKAIGPNVKIAYKVINYAQRLPSLASGSVDIVAHTMTINCDRWQGTAKAANAINFSSEYYAAGQKVLVRSDSDAGSISELQKQIESGTATQRQQKVCVAAGSTNLDNIASIIPKQNQVVVDDLGECLVDFQEGEATAITGDDTVLAGFAAQDPYAEVVGEQFSSEPYGLGLPATPQGGQFTRFVNAVLAQLRSDGTLQRLYDKWMAKAVTGRAPEIPQATYGRETGKLGRS